MPANKKVIISGGGTGGHIYPAISIAQALKRLDPTIEILFVGARGRMEMEKVPQAGFNIKALWISGLQRSLTLQNLSFPFKVISSVWNSFKIIKEFKPQAAIGVGGYASGPLLYAASIKGIPTLIQEQNSYPGITNKFLAKRVDKICVAYEGLERFFPAEKMMFTGNPIRKSLASHNFSKEEAYQYFNLEHGRPVVLVIGGSLGARSINRAMASNIEMLLNKGFQVIWQTGKLYSDYVHEYSKLKHLKVLQFIDRMDMAYATADIIVSRAGAGSIAELSMVAKPLILVPSPHVAEDHQTKNAMALVNKRAALMIKDHEISQKLNETILGLYNNKQEMATISEALKSLAMPNADEVIAREILNMIEKG